MAKVKEITYKPDEMLGIGSGVMTLNFQKHKRHHEPSPELALANTAEGALLSFLSQSKQMSNVIDGEDLKPNFSDSSLKSFDTVGAYYVTTTVRSYIFLLVL